MLNCHPGRSRPSENLPQDQKVTIFLYIQREFSSIIEKLTRHYITVGAAHTLDINCDWINLILYVHIRSKYIHSSLLQDFRLSYSSIFYLYKSHH